MRYLSIAFLVFASVFLALGRASDSKLEYVGGPLSEIRFILYETTFPVKFRALYDSLGGDTILDWQGGFSTGRGKPRHFETFAIRGVESKEGDYRLEVEFADFDKDLYKDTVLSARVCFVSDYGKFYADDLSTVLGPPRSTKKEKKGGEPGATDNPDDAQ